MGTKAAILSIRRRASVIAWLIAIAVLGHAAAAPAFSTCVPQSNTFHQLSTTSHAIGSAAAADTPQRQVPHRCLAATLPFIFAPVIPSSAATASPDFAVADFPHASYPLVGRTQTTNRGQRPPPIALNGAVFPFAPSLRAPPIA